MTDPGLANKNWALFDLLPVGIIILNNKYTILFWNQCIAEWTGIPATGIVGTRLFQRFKNLDKSQYRSRIDFLFSGGPAVLFSSQFHPHFIPSRLQYGTLRIQNTSVVPLKDDDNLLAMIVIEDVTDLVGQVRAIREMKNIADRELAELTKAQKALHIANSKLNMVCSVTRHDIKNQLSALNTYLLLSRESLSDPVHLEEYIDKQQKIVKLIEREVNLTGDYEGMGVVEPVWQRLIPLIRKAKTDHSPGSVRVEMDQEDIEVYADPLLEKVFYNLLDNTLRYGGDTLKTFRVSYTESGEVLTIICEDDGCGIPAHEKEKVFERGYGKNTGLGLFLVREILAITEITIKETGEPKKGARFEIFVPKGAYRYPDAPAADRPTG
jgi:PAS domain S-box-containing protein